MKKYSYLLAALSILTVVAYSCKKEATEYIRLSEPDLPAIDYNYTNVPLPLHFTFSSNNLETTTIGDISPSSNPMTDAGATLGRVLFYDRNLSLNNVISCGSCHKQQFAFSDGQQFSKGFELVETPRNSMAISNAAFQNQYFWDLRATKLELQVLMPVKNHIEMGMEKIELLPGKLQKLNYYPALFKKAFGSEEITGQRISKAMAQFIRAIVSSKSKWDEGLVIEDLTGKLSHNNFTVQEQLGEKLFEEKNCTNCHSGEQFRPTWGNAAANIGLDLEYADNGMGDRTDGENDSNGNGNNFSDMKGYFQVPSLRNIALTAPYMHDGRFKTLDEVIEHYNSGIKAHPNLDWSLRESQPNPLGGGENTDLAIIPIRMNLSQADKQAIIAYLKTLSDESFITDAKFSDPFVKR